MYNWQTEIIGEVNLTSKVDPFARRYKRVKNEEFVDTEIAVDDDGQPIYKETQKDVHAKQVAKYGVQVKDEGIQFLQVINT